MLLVASCDGDPVSSGGGSYAPEYHATVLSMNGSFSAVCGTGEKDLYAFGPAILHFDGTHWSPIESPPDRIDRALGFPDGSIVATGGREVWLRKNSEWTEISDSVYYYGGDIWGSSSDNLYVVGFRTVRHFDGATWSIVEGITEDPNASWYAIAGRSADDIVVAGDNGSLMRFNGTQWTTQIDSLSGFSNLVMTSSGRIFGSFYTDIYEITGNTYHSILHGTIVGAQLCADGDVLYAAGRLGFDYHYFVIAKYENDAWQNVALDRGEIRDLWAGNGNVIAGGRDSLWRGTASGGSFETIYPQRGGFACATNIDGAVFLAGTGAFQYENGVWTDLHKEFITSDPVFDMVGRNRNNIYAVGNTMLLHYDGRQWSWVRGFDDYVRSLWVDATGDVWVLGNRTTFRLHGSTWSTVDLPFDGEPVYDFGGTDEVMYAVGDRGKAAKYENGAWRPIPTGTTLPLLSVWCLDDHHVYATSYETSEVLVYDGRAWQHLPVDNVQGERIVSLWGTGASRLFALDNSGSLIHFDGQHWNPLGRILQTSYCVSGAADEVLVVGPEGVVSYRP